MTLRSVWIGLALLALVVGCGDEAPPTHAALQPMGAAAERHAAGVEAPSAGDEILEFAELSPNQAPRLLGVRLTPASRINGQDVTAHARVDDPDGDPVSIEYVWLVNGDDTAARGEVFSTRGLSRGDTVRVQVVASDGYDDSPVVLGPILTVENQPPVIVSQPVGAAPGGTFRYQVRVEDPDGDRDLRYRLERAPEGMSVSPAGGLVMWASPPDLAGSHTVEIVVQDAHGGEARQTFELIENGPGAAGPPAAAAH